MSNTNVLEVVRCPNRHNEEEFRVEAATVCKVRDACVEVDGRLERNETSWCFRPKCEHEGKCQEFLIAPTNEGDET